MLFFLDTDTTEEEVNDIKDKLESMSNVESLTYQSKSAVKEEMSKENEIFNEVMSTWDDEDNPLKDTFQVKVKVVERISNTAKSIEKIDKVSSVKYGEGNGRQFNRSLRSSTKCFIWYGYCFNTCNSILNYKYN